MSQMKINVTRRFDAECQVYAFDVKVDGQVHTEVSKLQAYRLILQAQEVARELGADLNLYGQHYLQAA